MSDVLNTIKELEKQFPHFTYRMTGDGYIQVTLRSGVTTYVKDEPTEENIAILIGEHKRLTVKREWEAKFPHLCFYVDWGATVPSDVWVKRDGRDAEGIPYAFYKHEPDYPRKDRDTLLRELAVWEEKATRATQKGWFLCFICGEPKPRSEYGYYHFCAEYCKDCLKTHPDVERSARNENYE